MQLIALFVSLLLLNLNIVVAKHLRHDPRTVQKKERKASHSLRFDWTNLPPISDLAKSITAFQKRCKKSTKSKVWNHLEGGVGQNLHTWALALCSSMDLHEATLVTKGEWKWASCDDEKYPMLCYFNKEHLAEGCEENVVNSWNYTKKEPTFDVCPSIIGEGESKEGKEKAVHEYMGAAMEYLFQSVSPAVILNAEKQAKEAFPDGLPDPADLITVHVRWGDKIMDGVRNLKISSYIKSIMHIVENRPKEKQASPVHIYLASEDPNALYAFRKNCPEHWNIHMSGPTQGKNKKMFEFASGLTGLESMGALLLSLQADNYVLATTSNWSRLINELREYVVNPRCNGCTRIIDLQEGQWPDINQSGNKHFFSSYFAQPTDIVELFNLRPEK